MSLAARAFGGRPEEGRLEDSERQAPCARSGARECAAYGNRARRIGEAAHPGPAAAAAGEGSGSGLCEAVAAERLQPAPRPAQKLKAKVLCKSSHECRSARCEGWVRYLLCAGCMEVSRPRSYGWLCQPFSEWWCSACGPTRAE